MAIRPRKVRMLKITTIMVGRLTDISVIFMTFSFSVSDPYLAAGDQVYMSR